MARNCYGSYLGKLCQHILSNYGVKSVLLLSTYTFYWLQIAPWRFDCITVLSESMFYHITVNSLWPIADLVKLLQQEISPWHAQKTGCIVLHCMSLSHEHSISVRTSRLMELVHLHLEWFLVCETSRFIRGTTHIHTAKEIYCMQISNQCASTHMPENWMCTFLMFFECTCCWW